MMPNGGADAVVDPYAKFRLRLRWQGHSVAGLSEVSALKRSTEVVGHREGAGQKPGGNAGGEPDHEAVVLTRGVTYDVDFHAWANRAWDTGWAPGPGTRREDVSPRPDLTLEVHNEVGQLVITYTLFRCWVSQYETVPDLDATANAVAIASIRLENEGWKRSDAVSEPTEPNVD
jgi:phage tail-like protein